MMVMNFKKAMKSLVVITFLGLVSACDKPNEVPPHSQAFIRQYTIPPPDLLSAEERELVNKQREEYNKL